MKYSQAFERDYTFYLQNLDSFDFAGKRVPMPPADEHGLSAKRCFFVFDSTGELLPCREPELLRKLFICKASVNLNIRLWAQGLMQEVLSLAELEEMLAEHDAPRWLYNAVVAQYKYQGAVQKNQKVRGHGHAR